MSTSAQTARMLPWAQVDVFAEGPYQGNMLAIFPDSTGLSAEQMQSLARETNLSETTFVFPGDAEQEREHGVRVRIFTVDEEFPFAGHPTLGTASWLWANHPTLRGAPEIRLHLNAGVIPVYFRSPAEGEAGVYGEMRQRDPEFSAYPDAAELAAACGLLPGDGHPSLPPQIVSTGLPFCVFPLASMQALQRLRIDAQALAGVLTPHGVKLVYAIVQTGANTWRARMPFKGSDDPATGSAAGCAISYLVQRGVVASGQQVRIEQGVEVKRRSVIDIRATLFDGQVTDVFVGGRTIPVASGAFIHP